MIISKINIHPISYLFILFCFMAGYFKEILIIISICLIHEIGHSIAALVFKYKIKKIIIYPFGGYTIIDKKINTSINKDILISLSGILMQLFFIFILYLFKEYIPLNIYDKYKYYNILIIIFNLLPIIPLDGSKIINLLLEKKFSFYKSYTYNMCISIVFFLVFFYVVYLYNIENLYIIGILFVYNIIFLKKRMYLMNTFLLERYLYDNDYKHIVNDTVKLKDLKKETYHYFRRNNHYLSEKKVLEMYFKCKSKNDY